MDSFFLRDRTSIGLPAGRSGPSNFSGARGPAQKKTGVLQDNGKKTVTSAVSQIRCRMLVRQRI
jgi:hypothetical protein